MQPEQILTCALDIGEQMLISGAEIGRVEETIRHICRAYGCGRADVHSITTLIVTTVEYGDHEFHTQSRRITGVHTDLTRLDRLNALSRSICGEKPEYEFVQEQIRQICSAKTYPLWLEALVSGLITGAFAVFFGGSWIDGAVAAVLGLGMRYVLWTLQKFRLNQILNNVLASFLVCTASFAATRLGLGEDVSMIIIGNIMPLIPGIALTNSLRDMISGDIMSGLLRFFDAMLVAAAIAAGYILAAQMMGGGL